MKSWEGAGKKCVFAARRVAIKYFGGICMKKTVVGIMLLIALLFVVSCGGGKEAVAEKEAPQAEEKAEATVSKVEILQGAVDSYFANMPDHIYKIGQKDFIEM